MPQEPKYALPFLTRDMLAFENGLTVALRVDMQSDTAATLALRGMTREATFEYKATTAADSTITSATFALSDIPIFVSIEDTARAFIQGSCFITISLVANGVVVQQLVSGYIYAQKALSWPNTQQVDLRPGGGKLVNVAGAEPAAGNIGEVVVPTGEIWLLKAAYMSMTASATVATRTAKLEIDDGAGGFQIAICAVSQTASQSRAYSFSTYGYDTVLTDTQVIQVNLPPNILVKAGGFIDFKFTNFQSGDNINNPIVTIEKFFSTP